MENNVAVSHTVKIKTVKNKIAPPFKEVELTLRYGHGFDAMDDLVTLATTFEVIKKAGSFYSYNDERIGQGKEKAVAFLSERPDLLEEIRARVLELMRGGPAAQTHDADPAITA
ncbi:hypothetical protein GCM10008955_33350 [Deinococcus malanensis]|uniref:RecA family profile 2 domain-containing protein n=1 Tax=Deinococcus malanensis TaxID=1706855 RepID=A0ABQ2F2W0_9DEIO|nr:hypothetical protein GCM10008955_33350 [Deinococcus malanensis]